MKKRFLLSTAFLFLIFSCKKEKEQLKDEKIAATANAQSNTSIESLTDFLSKSLNVNKDSILYNTSDSVFRIEHDMMISLNSAKKWFTNQLKQNEGPTTKHYRGPLLVSDQYISNIKVYIRAAVPEDWKPAIRQAMKNWNSTVTRVRFVSSSYDDADIRITGSTDGENGTIASAYLPLNHIFSVVPGDEVRINYSYSHLSLNEKIFAITHELGHTIGFKHTDQTEGTYIPGTPSSDYYSVMRAIVLPWTGFTTGDITATNILYPYSTMYYNVTYTTNRAFPKTDCGPGYIGTAHRYTVNAGTFQSVLSQEEADSRARTFAEEYGFTNANLIGQCVIQMIGGTERMWWQDQEIYTFYHKPAGSTVTWTVSAPLQIVGSNTGDSVTIQLDPAYPVLEGNTYGHGTITGTVGAVEYHKDIQIKYE